APRASSQGIELAIEIDADVPPWVVGDAGRIRQILTNFLGNGVKFTPRGFVTVFARRDGARIRLGVRDSGIGISSERLPAVFDACTQADTSTTRRYGGTGLGLSICKRLARLMAGEIGVHSDLGGGSTFWVDLPLKPASGRSEPDRRLTGHAVLVF